MSLGHSPPPIPTLAYVVQQREAILQILRRYGVSNLRVVGSVARGEAKSGSDIDFLVSLPARFSVFDMVALWLDLTQLLGYPVSLIPESAAHEDFMAAVLKDAVPL